MPISGLSCRASAEIDRATVERIVAEAERRGRVIGVRIAPADEDAAAPGPRPLRAADRNRGSPARCPTGSSSISAIKSISPKTRCHPACAIDSSGWRHFRIPSSTRRRRCGCRPTTSRASSPAPKTFPAHRFAARLPGRDSGVVVELGIGVVMREERNAGKALDVKFRGELYPEQALAARESAGPRHRRSRRHDGLWKDRRRGLADRRAQGQYAGSCASPAIAGTMGRATFGVSGAASPKPSAASAADAKSRPGSSMSRSSRAWSARTWSAIWSGDYGHLIVDECHHLSAQSFEQVVRRAKAKFVTGLSATVTRKDGHHPIVFMQCGPVRHRVDARAQAAARPFTHAVHVRPTGFRPSANPGRGCAHPVSRTLLGADR